MRRSRKGMKSGMKDFEAKTSPRQKVDTESWFIECYRNNQGHPLRTLVHLYKGNYHKFVLAVICFFAKHACVWVLPIITANIINDVTSHNPDTSGSRADPAEHSDELSVYFLQESGHPLCGDGTEESIDPKASAVIHFLSCGDSVRAIAVQDHA